MNWKCHPFFRKKNPVQLPKELQDDMIEEQKIKITTSEIESKITHKIKFPEVRDNKICIPENRDRRKKIQDLESKYKMKIPGFRDQSTQTVEMSSNL